MTHDYVALIQQYGYVATFAGTLLEGETLLILSGVAAHRGWLSLPVVIALGALGGALGDMAFFLIGRHYGPHLLERFPRFAPAAARMHMLIERHPTAIVLGVRFMYGLRTAGPAIIGTTRMPLLRFVTANFAGALLWSACWAGAGYLFGKAAEALLGDVARFERELMIGVLLAGIVAAVGLRIWRARGKG